MTRSLHQMLVRSIQVGNLTEAQIMERHRERVRVVVPRQVRRESTIERYLVAQLQALGVEVLKLTPHGRAGYQDRLLLGPRRFIAFVELKRPRAKLRKLQQHRAKQLRRYGFTVRVVDSHDKVDEVVRSARMYIEHGHLGADQS